MKKIGFLFVFIFCVLFSDNVLNAENPIRILAIGNSFSEDAVEQNLYDLARSAGDSLLIGNMYIGGCSLQRHLDNAMKNSKSYSYRKIVGGRKTVYPNTSLEEAIKDEDWDYITFQQASPVSGIYSSYAALTALLSYVKNLCTNKNVHFAIHCTWAYAANSTHKGFLNYHRNQKEMYDDIIKAVKKVAAKHRIKIIIPSGTAIQNARNSYLGDHMNRDGYHLSLGLGRYTAACTWFEKITGKSVVGNEFIPSGLSVKDAATAQEAAHQAVLHPYKVYKWK